MWWHLVICTSLLKFITFEYPLSHCDLLFHSFDAALWWTDILNFKVVYLLLFKEYFLCLKIFCYLQGHDEFILLWFLLHVWWFLPSTYTSSIHLRFVCACVCVMGGKKPFSYGHAVDSALFIKKTIFAPLQWSNPFPIIRVTSVGLFLDFLFCLSICLYLC